jgi:HAD superfamily hydrolase (TIGR01549 family)
MRAVVFDVDGTLYHAGPVRRAMMAKLAGEICRNPKEGFAIARLLRAYRHAHERLRDRADFADLAEAQLQAAVKAVGADRDWAEETIRNWMEHYPLDAIRKYARKGLADFLNWAESERIGIAALSDYPCLLKLAVLRVSHKFQVTLCAQDAAVQCLKPDPHGLNLIAKRLRVPVHEILYVGDRPEVDGELALRAGAEFALIDRFANLRARCQDESRGTTHVFR